MDKRGYTLRTLMLLVCLAVVGGSLFAFDFSTVENKITEFTLDNGMKFIVMEDHSAPVISFAMQADVGGVDDPKQLGGLAHLFEHMAFKGTSTIGTKDIKAERVALKKLDDLFAQIQAEEDKGAGADSAKLADLKSAFKADQDSADNDVEMNEFSTIVEREGGVGLNAGTSYDNTTYYYSFPSNKLELWFYLESNRFSDPVLRQLYKEKEVIKEERRMRVESAPIGRLIDEFLHAEFRAHPYGQALIGEMSEIDRYDSQDAMAFFKKYYVASNLTAAMVGDVDPAVAKKLAEKYFGTLPKEPKPDRLTIVEPEQHAERTTVVLDKSQPILLVGFHRPSVTDADDPVFDAISDYLGSGRTSLLYTSLVKEKKKATNASAFASFPGGKYPTAFGIFVVPAKGVTAPDCEDDVLAAIEQLKTDPISPEDLEKIKARAKANLVNSLSSRFGMATQLVTTEDYYGDWRALFKYLDKINAVTPDDIQRVAKTYFTRENRTVAYIETVED